MQTVLLRGRRLRKQRQGSCQGRMFLAGNNIGNVSSDRGELVREPHCRTSKNTRNRVYTDGIEHQIQLDAGDKALPSTTATEYQYEVNVQLFQVTN